ncbi:ABC transporter ATP-binding protein [Candidatus Fermentibacterales bacterium]|nr:ABC transporter ATP-binding protein [Candidatus Fermentibacterales bacterium]
MWFHDAEEETAEREARRYSTRSLISRMWPFVRPHVSVFLLGAGMLTLSVGGQLAGPVILKRMIDDAIPSGSVSSVMLLAGLFAAVFAVAMVIGYIQVIITTRVGLAIVRDLKEKVFRHMLTLSLAYFDRHSSGKLMARVESDSERVRMLFSEVSLALLYSFVLVVGTASIMLLTNSTIAIPVLLLIVPVAVLTFFFLKLMRKLYGEVRSAFAKVSGFVAEYVRAVPLLQVFRATRMAARKMHDVGRFFLHREVRAEIVDYTFWSFISSLEIAAVVLILSVGRTGILTGAISVGTIILFVEFTRRLFLPIMQFSETLNMVQRAFASADRIFTILDTETATPDGWRGESEFPRDWKSIRFENVWFRYGEKWALKDVSFELARGTTTALVGRSGGGKSTIVNLLLRFYEPTEGRIMIDGNDIREFELEVWRARLGLVLQSVSLFSGTLSDNVTAFNDEISEKEQLGALSAIDATYLLANFSNGLKSEISEGGGNLSMGERQLISLARAVLYDPDILILDEATSSVDPGTERRIQRATTFLTRDRTSIVVAHRLSTITHADRILVVQHGEIIESGNHSELLAGNGVYTGLCKLQLVGSQEY